MKKNYYRNRIILTFTIISTIIIIVTSRLSYQYLKDIYIEQIKENLTENIILFSSQIDTTTIKLLEIGPPTYSLKQHLKEKYFNTKSITKKAFYVFSDNSEILFSTNEYEYKTIEPYLMLNKQEVDEMLVGNSIASSPFQDDEGKWYLWGFNKITNNLIIAIKEDASRFDKLDSFSQLSWLISFVLIITVYIIAYFLSKSITKPINKLIEYSVEVSRGNHKTEMLDHYKGELKVLSDAVDKMKNSLINQKDEREQLLAQIAHEIRNPLGGIELLINLVKEDNNNPKHAEYFLQIQKELDRLKQLITSFLNFSKPDKANPKWVSINEIISKLKNILSNHLLNKQVTVNINLEFDNFYYDEDHLTQILLNLIHNSIEAVDVQGEINIQSYIKDNKWCIEVKDTGKGILEKDINKIFTPFFTTKKNGTGLGLAICKKLAKENDSDIYICNNDLFSICLSKEKLDEKL